MKVEWKIKKYKASAEKVNNELKQLGSFNPCDVLEKARNEDTELHKCFTWDDGIAAEKWRIQEARDIIRNIVIVNEDKKEAEPIRVYHIVEGPEEKKKSYQEVSIILRSHDKYQQLLENAINDLKAFEKKYKILKELDWLFEELHEKLTA